MGLVDFRPLLQVTINGKTLGGFLFSAISSVTVTDVAGIVSDSADITFSNTSIFQRMARPKPGAEIAIALGYLGSFRPMGLFIAEEIVEEAPPRSITISAIAKVQGETKSGLSPIHEQKTRSWPAGLTLKEIATTIADDNGLELAVTSNAAAIVPGHIDQIDESDLSVLTRIALSLDLIAKPAGGRLFVGVRAESKSASDRSMPVVALKEGDVSNWAARETFGEGVGTVIAVYRDRAKNKDVEVKIGEGKPERRLRQRFPNEAVARAVATAESRRSSRAVESLSITMVGRPSIVAEGIVVLAGFSSSADGKWVVEVATHTLSGEGYQTTFTAQRPE